MDCEGSEYAIFESLSEEILHKIEIIFLEVHPAKDRDPTELREY